MKAYKSILYLALLLGYCVTNLKAQDAILAVGNTISGINGSISYSIGQVFYTSISGTNGSLAMGVQQPVEISVVSGFEKNENNDIKCHVFPNPTAGNITLEIGAAIEKKLSYKIFNISGELLENKTIDNQCTTISMEKKEPAIYFLKLQDKTKELKTFKIIKY